MYQPENMGVTFVKFFVYVVLFRVFFSLIFGAAFVLEDWILPAAIVAALLTAYYRPAELTIHFQDKERFITELKRIPGNYRVTQSTDEFFLIECTGIPERFFFSNIIVEISREVSFATIKGYSGLINRVYSKLGYS